MKKLIVLLAVLIFAVSAQADGLGISVNMTDGVSYGTSAAQTAGAGTAIRGYWDEIAPEGAALGDTDLDGLRCGRGWTTGVTVTQSDVVGGGWNASPWATGFSGTLGNDMFDSFAETTSAYTYTFDNVTAGLEDDLYDVLIYSARGYGDTGVTQFDVNGETLFLTNENVVGDYLESGFATQALAEANPNSGNYVHFRNVSLDTLVIGISGLEDLTNGGVYGSVAGIQLVSFVPEPATLMLLSLGTLALRKRRA